MRDFQWSPTEKKIARKAFDLALHRELESMVAEVKRRAAKIVDPDELWALQRYLTKCDRSITEKYDYR